VWVVNQESDSISVVSVSKGIVTDTIYVPDEPADVVFSGSNAYVSIARNNQVAVIDTTTHLVKSRINLSNGQPKAMAVSADGSSVYVVMSVSGNQSTIIPYNLAPPPPPPTNTSLPPPPQVGLVVNINDATYSSYLVYKMPDHDVAVINTSTQTVQKYYSGVGTINLGIAVHPTTGDLYVTNTDAMNAQVRFEPNFQGHWVNNRLTRITLTSGTVQAFDLNPNINYGILPNPQALATALAQPVGAVFDPTGKFVWIASFGTDRVARVGTSGVVNSFIEIGPSTGSTVNPATKRGPRGLALNTAAHYLYVQNRISNTISVVDTQASKVVTEVPVGHYDPTPVEIVNGRGFLYDAKLSGSGTGACASCHVDAEMDHLAWDLGNPGGTMTTVVSNGQSFQEHPMKGPMVTQTLRGLLNLAPYHWRGDKPNFAAFNVAFQSLMGGVQLTTDQMNAYTAFINTIAFMPNPNQNLNRTLPTSLKGGNPVNGLNLYNTLQIVSGSTVTCQKCHTANPGPGTNLAIQQGKEIQPMKVPQLRNMYQKDLMTITAGATSIDGFGVSHDGSQPNMSFLLAHRFPILGQNPTDLADIVAYEFAFDTGMAPAVGYSRTATSANLTQTAVVNDIKLLVGQATAGNIDLIAKGTIQGVVHGLLYDPTTQTYQTDKTGLGPFTQNQLGAFIKAGDTLTFMGVPVGSGQWMGIDFDLDGVLDGDPGGNQ
jgi:YVTN family beta-propeller protein